MTFATIVSRRSDKRPGERKALMQLTKAKLAVAGLVAGGSLVAGAAFASWTSPAGSGNGYAKAGQARAVTIGTATASTTSLLFPGSSADVKIDITNPNSYPVKISSVAAGTGSIVVSGASGTCTTTGVTFNPASDSNGLDSGLLIGANETATLTLANGASMDNRSESGCQNATFAIPVSVTSFSAAS
jgi:hypothetical protein